MPPHREQLPRIETADRLERPHLWEDLLTGLSLGVFSILLACVLIGAWLYEGGL